MEFVGENGKLTGVKVAETEFVDGKPGPAGTERIIPADLVFLSLGFTGAEPAGIGDTGGRSSSTGAATCPATATT